MHTLVIHREGLAGGRGTMTRESLVSQTFVDLADSLVSEFDVVELMVLLSERTVELTGASATGLVLMDRFNALRLVAATSDAIETVELFQIQNQEGPCRDCCLTGEVIAADLRTEQVRWPNFVPVALAAGYASVHAFPLRIRAQTFGALGVFRQPGPSPTDADIDLTRAFAHVATIALVQSKAVRDAQLVTSQLQQALESRVVIEQAKGMLAEQATIDMDEAFARLRRHARRTNSMLTDAARAVVSGSLNASMLED